MLCENSKTTAYIKHVDTTAKNNAKNELQYLSNKTNKQTNKQTEIYILRLSFRTQLKGRVFYAIYLTSNCLDKFLT